jgi:outer membrane protein assembly factor BamB
LVGGDTAEVSGMKFSNDGKLMLLSTSNGHVYVVDAYTGRKVCILVLVAVCVNWSFIFRYVVVMMTAPLV